jgi:hypothetical protein
MSKPVDLGERLAVPFNVEIGVEYYYQVGKSEEYEKVTIIGKRVFPDNTTDNGFITTNPPHTMAVGPLIDGTGYNKFFNINVLSKKIAVDLEDGIIPKKFRMKK